MSSMTRNDLPIDKQREYDAIVEQCMKEIEAEVPEPRNTFDSRPDEIRREITQKYLPRLEQILIDAENLMN